MDDLISRQAAIDESYQVVIDGDVFDVVQVETLMGLPSAQPERKKRKWIWTDGVRCSACNHKLQSTGLPGY